MDHSRVTLGALPVPRRSGPEHGPGLASPAVPGTLVELGIPGVSGAVEIARGGHALVYHAWQRELARPVAVKVAASDNDLARVRFVAEGAALGLLSEHPHVIDVHGAGIARGRAYLVLAYARLGTLADQVRAGGPLPWQCAASIGIKLAGALHSAHLAGTVHRDVKPANVLISGLGEPLLADFGVAAMPGGPPALVRVPTSVPYAAPESLDGGPGSPVADVYSLAATVYFLLAGSPPFTTALDEAFIALYLRIASAPPPPLPAGVPADIAQVLAAALAKDPAERPADAAEFGGALAAALACGGGPVLDPLILDLRAQVVARIGKADVMGAAPVGRRGAHHVSSELTSDTDAVTADVLVPHRPGPARPA
ncbi:MAG: serine/threonine-protein kinase [Sporichthyaceae bacterium]